MRPSSRWHGSCPKEGPHNQLGVGDENLWTTYIHTCIYMYIYIYRYRYNVDIYRYNVDIYIYIHTYDYVSMCGCGRDPQLEGRDTWGLMIEGSSEEPRAKICVPPYFNGL